MDEKLFIDQPSLAGPGKVPRMASDLAILFQRIFDPTGFTPRWVCGQWSPLEGWLHIISDSVIAAAYVAIPASLFVLVRKRRDIEFPRIVWLFIAFILSCGIAHAFEASIFWWPVYRLTAVLKAITAVVSVATVLALIKSLPAALSISSLSRMQNECAQRLAAETALRETEVSRAEAERRSADLALRDRRLRDALVAARTCAVQWDVESAKIISETGYRPMILAAELENCPETLSWDALLGRPAMQALAAASRDCLATSGVINLRFPLPGAPHVDLRITATPEPAVAGQPRLMVGLLSIIPRDARDFATTSRLH